MDLGKLVTSQVSAEYVEPLFPKEGEPVSVALDFSPLVEVGTAMCVSNHKGLNWRHNPARREGGRLWFKLEGAWDPELLRWYFVFEAGGRFHYYSKRGVTTYPPAAKDHFRLKPGFDSPDWVAGATCYQIFPDRFANGDESNDVHDGDYVYDGHAVQARSFSDTPEDYSKAHCLDFYNGDLKGIEDHLDHLESIGVSCIYLNPIVDSRTMHRFDAVDYFHVDPKLGGDEALSSLIARCHERGIRVVVDISINHSSTENAWFIKAKADPSSEEAGFYYFNEDGSISCWDDVPTMPQLNFNSQRLRDLLYRAPGSAMGKFLVPPFGQDGWRLDVAPELGRHGRDQLCKEVWREVRKSLRKLSKDCYLVGEDWNDASEYLEGDMWDATMNYIGSGRPLRSWMGERDRFLTSAWGHSPEADNPYSASDLAAALQDAMDAGADQARFFRMNLFDSHDTSRLHNNKLVYTQGRYKGVVMALHLLPGMPNTYYGDEVGLAGRMGSVEGSRYPMEWDEAKWNMPVYRTHQLMGRIRRDKDLAYASTWFEPLDDDALLLIRRNGSKAWALVLNKGPRRSLRVDSWLLDGFHVKEAHGAAVEGQGPWELDLALDTSVLMLLGR